MLENLYAGVESLGGHFSWRVDESISGTWMSRNLSRGSGTLRAIRVRATLSCLIYGLRIFCYLRLGLDIRLLWIMRHFINQWKQKK